MKEYDRQKFCMLRGEIQLKVKLRLQNISSDIAAASSSICYNDKILGKLKIDLLRVSRDKQCVLA